MALLQRVQAIAQAAADLHESAVRLREQPERISPWMTTTEAADYLRYGGKSRLLSVYRFLKRHGIPVRRRGTRSILIARADLDRALKGK